MIDIYVEDLIDLHNACHQTVFRHPKTGRPAHISSIYRYILRGGKAANGTRVRLEVIKAPSGLRTSKQAIQRFIAAMSNQEISVEPSPSRQKEIADAESELRSAGFKLEGPI
jgi:hypothetical protein